MKELKCPKCGSVFTVDEADYASIISQVKNVKFRTDVDRRLEELHKLQQTELLTGTLKVKQEFKNLTWINIVSLNIITEIERQ